MAQRATSHSRCGQTADKCRENWFVMAFASNAVSRCGSIGSLKMNNITSPCQKNSVGRFCGYFDDEVLQSTPSGSYYRACNTNHQSCMLQLVFPPRRKMASWSAEASVPASPDQRCRMIAGTRNCPTGVRSF